MALSRRTGQRFQNSIWPGFVDAMTGLLLVLFFVLTIFMIVQFVQSETITGQESELDELAGDVAALAQSLGLERQRGAQLEAELGELSSNLTNAETQIAALTAERDRTTASLAEAETRITSFEAQVAALISERDGALGRVSDLETVQADLEAQQTQLLSEQEALNLALSQARTEIDAGVEAARLAAAQREAFDAMVADLQRENAEANDTTAALGANLQAAQEALSAEETARLAEAAAAEALRARLESADAELTAMTLTLEAQRQKAEETLTLLAAAESAQEDLDTQLITALLRLQEAETTQKNSDEAALQQARALQQEIDTLRGANTELQAQVAASQAELDGLRSVQNDGASALNDARNRIAELEAQVATDTSRANSRISQLNAERQKAQADLTALQDEQQILRAQLVTALQRLEQVEATVTVDRDTLRQQLRDALAAKLAAETLAGDQTTEAEKQAALLAQAQKTLTEEEEISTQAQRQAALLSQQVTALRNQLSELQGLLDAAKIQDASRDIQLQSLGSELNTALARVAAEERRRRELEEAERQRLEAERQRLLEEQQRLSNESVDLQKYRSEFFGRLRDILGTQEGVRIVGDRFVFSSEVLFPPGGAELSFAGQGEIAKIANLLRQIADDIPSEIDWVLQVDGHTDNIPLSGNGLFADNWELSQARALSVVKHMVNVLGIPPGRLSANGFGQYQPINPENTREARAQNRRIEIKFTEK